MPDSLHFELVINPADEARAKRELSAVPHGAARALRDAVNRTLAHGHSVMQRTIRGELNVSQKAALRAVTVHKATLEQLAGRLSVSFQPIPLGEFHPTQTRSGVRVTPRKSGGSQLIRHAFIAAMPLRGQNQREQHVGVFVRKPSARHKLVPNIRLHGRKSMIQGPALPIRELMGPTVIGVYADHPDRIKALEDELNAELPKNIESQIKRLRW